MPFRDRDTICAISTPYGCGGMAVIRVSGSGAITISDSLFHGRKRLSETAGGCLRHGYIERDGEMLDEVVAAVFRAPHSFTGEDVVEISCHGSIYIQQTLLLWLTDAGCRPARAGEFTQRAFLNGKLDLTEAEAVADLTAAQSKAEKDLAMSQLRGSVSNELKGLREQLLHITSLIELELDFADHEELEFADRGELQALCRRIREHIAALLGTFRTGQALRQGIPVAIIGAANAGKSTLLNALLGEERAIVSEIAGTTRDTIDDTLIINGVLFRVTDTAGLRSTEDRIEQAGIARSQQAAEKAMIVLHVVDTTLPDNSSELPQLPEGKRVITVYNKIDLSGTLPKEGVHDAVWLSARSGETGPLRALLAETAADLQRHTEGVCLSNVRHYDALQRAGHALEEVQAGLDKGLSGELLSLDLQEALEALGEVTGAVTSQEVLNNIFSHFCIGK